MPGPPGISLHDFIKQALLDICKGIIEAQAEVSKPRTDGKFNATICPIPAEAESVDWADYEREIEFDILVSGESRNVGTASAELKVFGSGGDLTTERTTGSTTAHRLKFAVPVVLPGAQIQHYKRKPKAS